MLCVRLHRESAVHCRRAERRLSQIQKSKTRRERERVRELGLHTKKWPKYQTGPLLSGATRGISNLSQRLDLDLHKLLKSKSLTPKLSSSSWTAHAFVRACFARPSVRPNFCTISLLSLLQKRLKPEPQEGPRGSASSGLRRRGPGLPPPEGRFGQAGFESRG